MKKLKLLTLSIIMTIFSANSYAGSFYSSDYFLPTVMGSVGAAACYLGNDGAADQAQQAAICGLVGAGLGYGLDQFFKNRYYKKAEIEINDLETQLQNVKIMQAQKSAKGEDTSFSIKIREYMPGKKHSDGSISSPHWKERLIVPGEGSMTGY